MSRVNVGIELIVDGRVFAMEVTPGMRSREVGDRVAEWLDVYRNNDYEPVKSFEEYRYDND